MFLDPRSTLRSTCARVLRSCSAIIRNPRVIIVPPVHVSQESHALSEHGRKIFSSAILHEQQLAGALLPRSHLQFRSRSTLGVAITNFFTPINTRRPLQPPWPASQTPNFSLVQGMQVHVATPWNPLSNPRNRDMAFSVSHPRSGLLRQLGLFVGPCRSVRIIVDVSYFTRLPYACKYWRALQK